MTDVVVNFADVDGDGDREVVVENSWLRMVLRFPENMGEAFYGRRFTWGGRLQSLVYKPSGREYFMPEMIDPEDVRPFGLPDELFAHFPLDSGDGVKRELKMGVGVFREEGGETLLEPLPWTWREEESGAEKAVIFRQQGKDLGGYSFGYEKRYRFRADSAWFALDLVWENDSERSFSSEWDIHSFHQSGAPPHSSWFMAPKRAWVSYGNTRLRTVLKEVSPIFATLDINTYVAGRIAWDLDEEGWWYALGPGDGEEFYLLRGRFEPCRGLFWHAWRAFTPQGISRVEVPAGDRAIWGFDVTLGEKGRNFVKAAEDCGLTIDEEEGRVRVGVHVAGEGEGLLAVSVMDHSGALCHRASEEGSARPGAPLQVAARLPDSGDFAVVAASFQRDGQVALQAREIVPLKAQRPTARLPFKGDRERVFVASDPQLEDGEVDYLHLCCHSLQCGFGAEWSGSGPQIPASLHGYAAAALVGDAWPLERTDELRRWVEEGGGLLLCAPFGRLASSLGGMVPLQAEGDGRLQRADPELGLQLGTPHYTAERLMLDPDAAIGIAQWTPAQARPGAFVTLRFNDAGNHPAVALSAAGKGRVAAVASRSAWGEESAYVIWDGWGQYHRALFGGLIGWVARAW